MTNLKYKVMKALLSNAEGAIEQAQANILVYLYSPAGIGEHPDVLGSIQSQLDIIAHHEERINVINKYFTDYIEYPTNSSK